MSEFPKNKDDNPKIFGEKVSAAVKTAQIQIEKARVELLDTVAMEIEKRKHIETTKKAVLKQIENTEQESKNKLAEKFKHRDEEIDLANTQIEQALVAGDIAKVKKAMQDLIK